MTPFAFGRDVLAAKVLVMLREAGCAALALVVLGAGCSRPADVSRCNVVLISVDTLRADRLGAYGYRQRETSPNLDHLARDGILFENHMAASPWTVPSHVSLLTSLHPTAHGVTSSFRVQMHKLGSGGAYDRIPEATLTLAEALAASGRASAAFTGGVTLDPRIGFGQGFDTYETDMYKLSQRKIERMLDWAEGRGGEPFFLFWHTFEVHAPYLEPDFLPEVLPAEQARRLVRGLRKLRRTSGSKSTREGSNLLEQHGAYTLEVCEALYDAGVLSFDRWLGELVGRLLELDLYDRTLIVFTSDHGEQLGERKKASTAARRAVASTIPTVIRSTRR